MRIYTRPFSLFLEISIHTLPQKAWKHGQVSPESAFNNASCVVSVLLGVDHLYLDRFLLGYGFRQACVRGQ